MCQGREGHTYAGKPESSVPVVEPPCSRWDRFSSSYPLATCFHLSASDKTLPAPVFHKGSGLLPYIYVSFELFEALEILTCVDCDF